MSTVTVRPPAEPARRPIIWLDQADYERLCTIETAHRHLRADIRTVLHDAIGQRGLPRNWRTWTVRRLTRLLEQAPDYISRGHEDNSSSI